MVDAPTGGGSGNGAFSLDGGDATNIGSIDASYIIAYAVGQVVANKDKISAFAKKLPTSPQNGDGDDACAKDPKQCITVTGRRPNNNVQVPPVRIAPVTVCFGAQCGTFPATPTPRLSPPKKKDLREEINRSQDLLIDLTGCVTGLATVEDLAGGVLAGTSCAAAIKDVFE
ncbi:hypothetical protein [Sphingomonas sp.]|uniref:hypothetical protein n=1 Tax=Sphingomonas sp. TaxID=28214 RepID=UPI003B00405E